MLLRDRFYFICKGSKLLPRRKLCFVASQSQQGRAGWPKLVNKLRRLKNQLAGTTATNHTMNEQRDVPTDDNLLEDQEDQGTPRSVYSILSSHHSSNSRSSFTSGSSISTTRTSALSNLSKHSHKKSNYSIASDDTNEKEVENHVFDIAVPDPKRALPVKYSYLKQRFREYFLKDWGNYGKQTTWDVTAEFKEKHRLRNERETLKNLREERDGRLKKEADDKKWLADNFRHKKFLLDQQEMFDRRRIESKIAATNRRQVNWKRVHDRQTVGRVVAEAAAARRFKEDTAKHDAFVEATRISDANAKTKALQDAANLKQSIQDDDEFCDNLARKFGVYAGIPQPVLPEPVPGLPPKQATHLTVGWIIGEAPVDSDTDEEEEVLDDSESGGIHGRLSADLFIYAYAESLKGQNLGQDGARALAKILSPKPKGGHHTGGQDLEPGACENLTKLVLRYNKLHLHGTRYITQMFPKGAVPMLQVLDLAGNKIGNTGARYVAEAMSERKALPHLKVLDLSSNTICDDGGYSLATGFYSGRCKKLETVKLSDNWMGSKGIVAVIRALSTPPFKKLRLVSLRRNRLRPKMLKRLRNDHPKWLSL